MTAQLFFCLLLSGFSNQSYSDAAEWKVDLHMKRPNAKVLPAWDCSLDQVIYTAAAKPYPDVQAAIKSRPTSGWQVQLQGQLFFPNKIPVVQQPRNWRSET